MLLHGLQRSVLSVQKRAEDGTSTLSTQENEPGSGRCWILDAS